jgi:photosystem II stability/assembly factor-like uncharacterized protein
MTSIKCKPLHSLIAIVVLGFATSAAAIDLLELPAVQSGAATRTMLLDVAPRGDSSFTAVGQFGVIVNTGDDGASWKQASVPAFLANLKPWVALGSEATGPHLPIVVRKLYDVIIAGWN